MRGKRIYAFYKCLYSGITPAHAGKTLAGNLQHIYDRDHPRACGENFPYDFPINLGKGSPPRMRGKHTEKVAYGRVSGITPAHAGKTFPNCFSIFLSWDHPRACGENTSERAYFRG